MRIKPSERIKELVKLRQESTGARRGISTGLLELDDLMSLQKSYLFLCTGNSSSGKSEFMDQLALNTAIDSGWKWAIFSPENSPIDLHIQKYNERYLGKGNWQMTPKEIGDAADYLNQYFTWLNQDEEDRSVEQILEVLKQEKEENGLDAYILDPWNEASHSKYAHLRDDQYLSHILTVIRNFNRKYDLLGCIVIHPKTLQRDKNGDYPIPTLSDCHGGIMWRNKADYGVCVHRPDMSKNRVTVYVQKIKFKHQGHVGSIELDYDLKSGRFKCINQPDFTLPSEITSAF